MPSLEKLQPTALAGVYQIAVPTPFKVGPVNVYWLEGDLLTLIDTGPRTDEALDYLAAAIGEHGYQLSDIERLIISHHHIDHLGLTAGIVEASGAPVMCHPYCAPYLEAQNATLDTYVNFVTSIYAEAGVPPDVVEKLQNSKTWYDRYGSAPVDVEDYLSEGDTLQAAGYAWQVFYTPGHAGDLICFYDPDSTVLLASDHLILKISSNPLLEPAPIQGEGRPPRLIEYLHHLQRIAELDIAIAYSGHGKPITDVQALVAERIAFHKQRADHIFGLFEGQPHNLWEMTEKLFGHVGLGDKYLALSEVLGHIDLLEADRCLSRFVRDGIVYWEPVSSA